MVYLVYSMAMITLIGQSQHHRHREQATVDNKTLKSNVKSLPAVGLGRFRLGGLSTYREYKCCCSVPATWYTRKRAHAFVNSIAMASSAFIGERDIRVQLISANERGPHACTLWRCCWCHLGTYLVATYVSGARSKQQHTEKIPAAYSRIEISRYVR